MQNKRLEDHKISSDKLRKRNERRKGLRSKFSLCGRHQNTEHCIQLRIHQMCQQFNKVRGVEKLESISSCANTVQRIIA